MVRYTIPMHSHGMGGRWFQGKSQEPCFPRGWNGKGKDTPKETSLEGWNTDDHGWGTRPCQRTRDRRILSLMGWRHGYIHTYYYHHQQTRYLQPKQEQINENRWSQDGSRAFLLPENHRISFPFLEHKASSTINSLQKSQGWKGNLSTFGPNNI